MTARNVASGFKCLVRSALAWTIASALIALIGLCFIAWDHFSPKKKELRYAVATTPLIANVEGKPSALHIYYKSEEVSDVQSVQVFVRNTGDIPIRASDFDEPLTVAIAPGHLLDAHITSSFPANLPAAAKPSVSAASVSVAPLLLNPGDQFIG